MRTKGSKNRPIEERLRLRVEKLESDRAKDMRIMWTKLRTLQNIQRVQSQEIGKIIRHLKGRDLWFVEEKR